MVGFFFIGLFQYAVGGKHQRIILFRFGLLQLQQKADHLIGIIPRRNDFLKGTVPIFGIQPSGSFEPMDDPADLSVGLPDQPLFFLIQSVFRRQFHVGQCITQRDTIILYGNIQVIFQQMMQGDQRGPIQFPVRGGQNGKETCRNFFKQLHRSSSFCLPFYIFMIYDQCIICIVQ